MRGVAVACVFVTACFSITLAAEPSSPDIGPRGVVPAQPRGFVKRYLVTEMRSVLLSDNAMTSIRITNLSGKVSCSYIVEYYLTAGGAPVCSVTSANVPDFGTAFQCSRTPINMTAAFSCGDICNPQLTGHAGKALIYSSQRAGCEKMAVNAVIVTTSTDDTVATSARTPKIVNLQSSVPANIGD